MGRPVFNFAAGLSLLACLGVLAGWAWSYAAPVHFRYYRPDRVICGGVAEGRVYSWKDWGGYDVGYDYEGPAFQWLDHPAWGYPFAPMPWWHLGFRVKWPRSDDWRLVLLPHGPPGGWVSGLMYELIVPHWALAAMTAIAPALWWRSRRRTARRRRLGLCAVCGYDLRATPERCPECGTMVTAPPGNPRSDEPRP